VLLRESYREGGKVKNPTLANLSHWPEHKVEALRLALKGTALLADRKRSVNPYAQVTDGTGHSVRHRVCWLSWGPSPRTIVSVGGL